MRPDDAPIQNVLLVEDEAPYGEAITRLHEIFAKTFYGDCQMHLVGSWEAAVGYVAANPVDVIVLDLTLIPNSPEHTLERLKATWQAFPPVLVLTGNEDAAMRRKAMLSGADSFMVKLEANRHTELFCEKIYNCFLRRLRDERA